MSAAKCCGSLPTTSLAADHPDPASPVYSLGHRNNQGLAFDDDGPLWASEFGAGCGRCRSTGPDDDQIARLAVS